MFIELMWKKNGETKKTCVHISKLFGMTQALEREGLKSWYKSLPDSS